MKQLSDLEWDDLQKSVDQDAAEIARIKTLVTRAADALEKVAIYVSGDADAYRYLRLEEQQLITELRKAAQ